MSNKHQELTSPEQTAPGKDCPNPLIVDSLLKTIWVSMHICFNKAMASQRKRLYWSAEIVTDDDGSVKIHATIDGHSLSISEGSLRRHLKLDDHDGILPLFQLTEIFAQLALYGRCYNLDNLTFQKRTFSPQWRFLIHNILHGLSPKKMLGEQLAVNCSAVHLFSSHVEWLEFRGMDLTKTKQTSMCSSDAEGVEDDSSKQGRKFSNEGFKDAEGVHEKASTETELFIQEITPTEARDKVTASEEVHPVSTAGVHISTAGETATYSRRSAEKRKDKGKGLKNTMHEEQGLKLLEHARDCKTMGRRRKRTKATWMKLSYKEIDWNDPSVLRYHSLKMKPKSTAQARRNMVKYLKNQGNFKISDFKGMSYNERKQVRSKSSPGERSRSLEKIMEEKVVTQEKKEVVPKRTNSKRGKKSILGKQQGNDKSIEMFREKMSLKGVLDVCTNEKKLP
ncbi:hypothetical protein Tco_0231480 [Tanacetum coccineum]